MKQIVIGDKPLMQISEEDIFQVAVIQGCCAHPDYWNYPTLTEYNNTIFRDSVWCSYKSTREEDPGHHQYSPKTTAPNFHHGTTH